MRLCACLWCLSILESPISRKHDDTIIADDINKISYDTILQLLKVSKSALATLADVPTKARKAQRIKSNLLFITSFDYNGSRYNFGQV